MFDWVVNTPLILATMFKADNSKNRLKHEICSKLTLKPLEQNRKNLKHQGKQIHIQSQ